MFKLLKLSKNKSRYKQNKTEKLRKVHSKGAKSNETTGLVSPDITDWSEDHTLTQKVKSIYSEFHNVIKTKVERHQICSDLYISSINLEKKQNNKHTRRETRKKGARPVSWESSILHTSSPIRKNWQSRLG